MTEPEKITLDANSEYEIAARVSEVLVHTEIIPVDGMEIIASPGQVWLMGDDADPIVTGFTGGSVSWEVELPEDQFWRLIEAVLGHEAVVEMKHDLDDLLRWEGEGGPCLS